MEFCTVFCWSFCNHTCVFWKGTFPFWKVNVCLCERQMCVYKENIINWRFFVYERKMCVYERNISLMKDKCVFWKANVCFQKRKCWKHRFQKVNVANTSLKTQISHSKGKCHTQKTNAKKGNVPFVMCLFSRFKKRNVSFKREMSLLKEKCVF